MDSVSADHLQIITLTHLTHLIYLNSPQPSYPFSYHFVVLMSVVVIIYSLIMFDSLYPHLL